MTTPPHHSLITQSSFVDDTPLHNTSPEELTEQRSQWLAQLLEENPQLLALRERVLPWTGGYSFANVVHTDTTAVLSHVNRHKILELIYQHLNAIGMHQTAEILKDECGHEFQMSDQHWDKTDLLILVSLGVLPREDPWKIAPDPHHRFVEELLEEDFFASSYVEDPNLLYLELHDPNLNAVYKEKSTERNLHTLKEASLKRLIVYLATSTSDQLSDDDLNQFFLTLHSVTSSHHFLEHLMYLFDFDRSTHQEIDLDFNRNSTRLVIVNLIKKWVNYHGTFIGNKTIKAIARFLRRIIDDKECSNLHPFASQLLVSIPKLRPGPPTPRKSPVVTPEIPNAQIIFQPNLRIIDPHPMEVARQITLIFHTAFKAVHSREFIIASRDHCISHQTPTLAEFTDFGKRLTLLVLELIATTTTNDPEKVIPGIIEIASCLDTLNNFEALSCFVRALRRDEILQLNIMQQPNIREKLDLLYKRCGDDPTSKQKYLEDVNTLFSKWEACIPNIKTELDIESKHLKVEKSKTSPSFINGLINWEQIWSNSGRTLVFYRFQFQCPYNFWTIPQIKKAIEKGPTLTEQQVNEKLTNLRRTKTK
ncbi:RasGEF domain containing protein [Tritrichomonas foetus]|uniref:RasGEF domain containing protein n=1 Tax=Tritrichomonas foetus TaxID=1144522 RepID=A0A1J4K147_9EUKA|nr:RasGEF domain containing protein [Tritrichomonas foetus]|eukprot:OHT03468.1 RasGEF domain containing protein [Tritrichomonas foetus]